MCSASESAEKRRQPLADEDGDVIVRKLETRAAIWRKNIRLLCVQRAQRRANRFASGALAAALTRTRAQIAEKLPISIRYLLECAVRRCDGFSVKQTDVERILDWRKSQHTSDDVPFCPARVLLQVADCRRASVHATVCRLL